MILFKTLVRNMLISDVVGDCIRFFKQDVRIGQLNFGITSKQIRGKIVALLYFNKYEKEELEMIRAYMRTDLPIVDLGSSLGVVATTAARISDQKITCVEANPELIPIISDNLRKNGREEEGFSVVNAAICDKSFADKFIYFSSRGSNELGRICDADTEGAIEVKAVLLSELLRQEVTEEYILISDVEGAESAFLFSDSEALKNCSQLFIELHPVKWNGVELSVDDLRQRIESLGFIEKEQKGTNFYYTRHEEK